MLEGCRVVEVLQSPEASRSSRTKPRDFWPSGLKLRTAEFRLGFEVKEVLCCRVWSTTHPLEASHHALCGEAVAVTG